MISGKNIFNKLCEKQKENKNLIVFPVLIPKAKIFNTYKHLGEKEDRLPMSISKY